MRAALLLLAALLLTPLAAAQVPDDPVALACDAVGGPAPQARDLLPVCASGEPQPPAAPQEEHAHAPPAQAPAEEAQELVQQALDDVQSIPEDPAGAPERLVALVATVIQFVKDLLQLPVSAAAAVGGAFSEGIATVKESADAAKEAATGALDAARAAGAAAVESVKGFLAGLAPEAPQAPAAREALPEADVREAVSLVDGVVSLVA